MFRRRTGRFLNNLFGSPEPPKPSPKQTTSPETRSRSSKRDSSPATTPKLSRNQPSEPMHMTTRSASRAASAANSTNASVISGDSRRSSLNSQVAEKPSPSIEKSGNGNDSPLDADLSPSARGNGQSSQTTDETGHQLEVQPIEASKKRKRSLDIGPDENTPNASNALSEETDNHDTSDAPPPLKKRSGRKKLPVLPVLDLLLSSADVTPAIGTPLSVTHDAQPSIAGASGYASQEPGKVVKRLPGRRRAPNPDVNIEADLRRQLQLKTGYRSIVKALKPVLAELAERTANTIRADPHAHENCGENEIVKAQLDALLQKRLARLKRTYQIKMDMIDRVHTAEVEIEESQLVNSIEFFKENNFLRCQNQLLTLERETESQMDYATEDEGPLVPPRQGMQYPYLSTGPLEDKYDSRGRFYKKAEKLWSDREVRYSLAKGLEWFLERNPGDYDSVREFVAEGFTVYNTTERECAFARFNISKLVEAAQDVEAQAAHKPAPVLNEAAAGLHLLASAMEIQRSPTPSTVKPATRQESASFTPIQMKYSPEKASDSPKPPPSATSTAMSLETENSSLSPPKPSLASITNKPPPDEAAQPTNNNQSKPHSTKITDLLNKEHEEPASAFGGSLKTPRLELSSVLAPSTAVVTNKRATASPIHAVLNGTPVQRLGPDKIEDRKVSLPSIPGSALHYGVDRPGQSFWSNIKNIDHPPRGPSPEKNPIARIQRILNATRAAGAAEKTLGGERVSYPSARVDRIPEPRGELQSTRVTMPLEGPQGVTNGVTSTLSPPKTAVASHIGSDRPVPSEVKDHGYRPIWDTARRASMAIHDQTTRSPRGPIAPQPVPAIVPPVYGQSPPNYTLQMQAPPPGPPRPEYQPPAGPPAVPQPYNYSYQQPTYPPQAHPPYSPANYAPPPNPSPYGYAPQPAYVPVSQPPPPSSPPYAPVPPSHVYPGYPPHQHYTPMQSPYPPVQSQYNGPQYGGQRILPANPPPTPSAPFQQHPPVFSQQQHLTSRGSHHDRRGLGKNYGGYPNREFRRYTGPK